jgi:ureidoglycolate lyase
MPPRSSVSDIVTLAPIRLSPDAFSPFGSVVCSGRPIRVNDGFAVRRDTMVDLPCSDPDARLCLSHFDVEVRPIPIEFAALERHPHSAQVFLPLSPCRALVVAAAMTSDGGIDFDGMTAFVAAPGDGILYSPGVWHLGLTSLDRPARFQMAMWSGTRPDTEIRPLPRTITIDTAALRLDSVATP